MTRRRIGAGVGGFAVLLATLASPATPVSAEAVVTLSFNAVADAYVSSDFPTQSYGKHTALRVDQRPAETSYLRFDVSGLAGRTTVSVRLRLTQRNSSPAGGHVHLLSDTAWTEAVTYETRPVVDGPRLGSFGAVQAGATYEVELEGLAIGDGPVSFAVVGADTDSSVWYSRESKSGRPSLIVDVEPAPPSDGVSQVADPTEGSSDPTYFPSSHHLAVTFRGRLLTVHGRHADGVQLAWRDPSGSWRTVTRGSVTDGRVISGTSTGDWPSSIAVGRDAAGGEHAWLVASGTNFTRPRALYLRRITDLDAPSGPVVGPLVTLEPTGMGQARADIQVSDGRAAVTWSRRSGDSAFQQVTGWLSDLGTDTPALTNTTVHFTTTSASRWATLVPGGGVMRVIARAASGRLTQFTNDSGSGQVTWQVGSGGPTIAGYPSAAILADGTAVVAVETDVTKHLSSVHRIAGSGAVAPAELTLDGYAQPSIATDGSSIWVVAVRVIDGTVVSRRFTPGSGWDVADHEEIAAAVAGRASYPNALRQLDGYLQFVVRGPSGGASQYAVLAAQRSV